MELNLRLNFSKKVKSSMKSIKREFNSKIVILFLLYEEYVKRGSEK